jgi:hypothetical protein
MTITPAATKHQVLKPVMNELCANSERAAKGGLRAIHARPISAIHDVMRATETGPAAQRLPRATAVVCWLIQTGVRARFLYCRTHAVRFPTLKSAYFRTP